MDVKIDNKEVAHSLKPFFSGMVVRPYNFNRPETSEWWFIPSKDWPAYRHSKIFVWQTPPYSVEPGFLYLGYYVEHGISPEIPGVARKFVMDSKWSWHDFIRSAKDGTFDKVSSKISSNLKIPVWVLLKAYEFNRIPELGGDSSTPYDQFEMLLGAQQKHQVLQQPASKVLKTLNSSKSLADLSATLEANAQDLSFFWIDVLIGVHIDYDTVSANNKDARILWETALQSWLPFVK